MKINTLNIKQTLAPPSLFLLSLLILTAWMLTACGGGGGGTSASTGAPPGTSITPPASPTGLALISGCNAVNLSWTAVTGATGYNVYGAASGVPVARITTPSIATTAYTDAGLASSTSYHFQVSAVNAGGESALSAPLTTTTTAACTKIGGSVQGNPLPLSTASSTTVSTLAGSVGKNSLTNGTGSSAQFFSPAGIATDGTNLYVADNFNNAIRQIVISTGAVTTLAGTGVAGNVDTASGPAQFNGPQGITIAGTNLYVADTNNNAIRQIVISTGVVTTLVPGSGGLSSPTGITADGSGNLYVADSVNNAIKTVPTAGGVLSSIATVTSPQGITTNGTNLYVTSGGSIYQLSMAGATTATMATGLSSPQGITTDGTNLYVANTANDTILQIPISSPTSSIIAGASGISGSADATPGTNARFYIPGGITTDGTNLYITDTGNQTIRKIQ